MLFRGAHFALVLVSLSLAVSGCKSSKSSSTTSTPPAAPGNPRSGGGTPNINSGTMSAVNSAGCQVQGYNFTCQDINWEQNQDSWHPNAGRDSLNEAIRQHHARERALNQLIRELDGSQDAQVVGFLGLVKATLATTQSSRAQLLVHSHGWSPNQGWNQDRDSEPHNPPYRRDHRPRQPRQGFNCSGSVDTTRNSADFNETILINRSHSEQQKEVTLFDSGQGRWQTPILVGLTKRNENYSIDIQEGGRLFRHTGPTNNIQVQSRQDFDLKVNQGFITSEGINCRIVDFNRWQSRWGYQNRRQRDLSIPMYDMRRDRQRMKCEIQSYIFTPRRPNQDHQPRRQSDPQFSLEFDLGLADTEDSIILNHFELALSAGRDKPTQRRRPLMSDIFRGYNYYADISSEHGWVILKVIDLRSGESVLSVRTPNSNEAVKVSFTQDQQATVLDCQKADAGPR